jgi:phosphoribosylformylglycinamidine synthase
MKVETHNHPTAISPFPGASTGAGGEIRDEGATGRGAKPKAGLTGFTVSNLNIPGFEQRLGKPGLRQAGTHRLAAADHDRRPARRRRLLRTNSAVRSWAATSAPTSRTSAGALGGVFGYHKPIMIAGGIGNISDAHTHKNDIPPGSLLIQLGGPGMRIGMAGAAASSMATGTNTADLDFDSVQRGNPEMERRAQEVINACWQLGEANPIISIHDVGAGGISNAFPEITNDAKRGATFDLRKVPLEESGMSPREIWSTSRRSAMCWRLRRKTCRALPPCASASAARSPPSASPPKSASCA